MVRCRSQEEIERKITLKDALENESRFFEMTEWTKSIAKDSLGVPALRLKLSEIYFEIIRKNVDDIKKEIQTKQRNMEAELQSLGSSLRSPGERRVVYERIVQSLKELLSGNWEWSSEFDEEGYTVRARLELLKERFAADLLASKFYKFDDPIPVPRPTPFVANGEPMPTTPPQNANSTFGGAFGNASGTSTPQPSTGANPFAGFPGRVSRFESPAPQVQPAQPMVNSAPAVVNHVPYLVKQMSRHRSDGIVVFEGRTVFDAEVRTRVDKEWKPLCDKLSADLIETCAQLLWRSLDDTLRRQPVDRDALKFVFRAEFDRAIANAKKSAERLVEHHIRVECSPFTLNHYLTETIQKKRNEKLKAELIKLKDSDGKLAWAAIEGALEKTSQKPLIEAVAEDVAIALASYAKVAGKRLGDTLPAALEHDVIRPLIRDATAGLSHRTDEDITKLFPHAEKHARHREEVQQRFECLNTALRVVDDFVLQRWSPAY